MRERNIKAAPNYTVPALIMAGVNLMWIFVVIWAAFGLGSALFKPEFEPAEIGSRASAFVDAWGELRR